jgi:membrane protein implicated in regulation of membrane protease activity
MDPEVMNNVFLVCFLLGGTVMVCQFLLSLLGLGGHHDIGGDAHDISGGDFHDVGGHDVGGHDAAGHGEVQAHGHAVGHEAASTWLVGVLTFRTIVAALTFFGLGGMAALGQDLAPSWALAVALAGGLVALFLVAWIMRSLSRLQAEGTVRMERAVGKTGTVYLTIPGNRAGLGKVQLNLQNRTVECLAVTPDATLTNGSKIVVTAVIGKDTVEVAPVPPSTV